MEKIQSAIEKARIARYAIRDASAEEAARHNGGSSMMAVAARQEQASAAAWAALPEISVDGVRMRDRRIVAFAGGKDAVPFDMMRTKVIQQMRLNGWHRLAITSPAPTCGKSTIALNLAMSLARNREVHTILAEVDLRRPSLAAMLGIGNRRGFAEVLAGRAVFADAAQRFGSGLAMALSDGPVHNSAELLNGQPVAEALDAIEARYAPDIMIFDMPPMLVSDDTMVFAHHVDAVLLIAGAESTTIKEIDSCERELATQTNVMGIVLNKCHFSNQEYDYDYYG